MQYLSLKIPGASGGQVDVLVPSGIPTGGLEANGAAHKVISLAVDILFVGAILLTLGNLIFAGWQFITSEGDKAGIEAARQRIIFAILGLAIVLLSFLVVYFVGSFFGVELIKLPNQANPCFGRSGGCAF